MGEFPNRETQFGPGNNANPEGRNQFTYRAEAEKNLDEWCKENGRDLIREIADAAKARRPWAAKLMLDRILPAIERHEHAFPDAAEAGDVLAQLAQFARAKRANGDGREDEPPGPNGADGSSP